MADEAKYKGNAAFFSSDFTFVVRHFSDAIEISPDNHVLFSNRSAAYASLKQYNKALKDTVKTVELKKNWAKGYGQLSVAFFDLEEYEAAIQYLDGLEIDPDNESLKEGLDGAWRSKSQLSEVNLIGDVCGPDTWVKLAADPSRDFMQEEDFKSMIKDIQKSPKNLNLYSEDPRFLKAFNVLLKDSSSDNF